MRHLSIFPDVYQFLRIGHPDKLADVPRIPPKEIVELSWNLIDEEFTELKDAKEAEDLTEIADAIADLIWVLVCMAYCYGLPIQEIWDEVARTNHAKFPGGEVLRRPEDGKILKPPGWKPPDIARIINEAKLCVVCEGSKRTGMGVTCGHSLCVEEECGEK